MTNPVDLLTNPKPFPEKRVLIIAKSDILSDGLITVLSGILPGIETNLVDEISLVGIQMAQKFYDAVILYPSIPYEDMLMIVRAIKTSSPKTSSIMIVDEKNQISPALQAGTDQVLMRGFNTNQLRVALNKLNLSTGCGNAQVDYA
jgi:DNA-binding response OmpR family regulator